MQNIFIFRRDSEREIHWTIFMRALLKGEKPVDWLVIRLSDGTTESIYFDVSEFFGKG